jgi:hypothetical protein
MGCASRWEQIRSEQILAYSDVHVAVRYLSQPQIRFVGKSHVTPCSQLLPLILPRCSYPSSYETWAQDPSVGKEHQQRSDPTDEKPRGVCQGRKRMEAANWL